MDNELLRLSLELAVPLRIEELRSQPFERRVELGRTAVDHLSTHGDDVLYRSRKRGDTAVAFNHLVMGLACLAFAPGGVNAFGLRFEA